MTYPLKFRQKVFEIKDKKGLTFRETSHLFEIDLRTLFRWQERIEPCLTRNKPAVKIDMSALAKDLEERPDDYQYERAERFNVSARGIGLAIKRLGITVKKKL